MKRLPLLLLLWAAPAWAQEGSGFAELRLSLHPGTRGDAYQLVERVRPTFETELGERVKLVATIEAGLRQGRDPAEVVEQILRQSQAGPFLDAAGCTFPRHENSVLGIDQAHDYLDVDRLYLDLYLGAVDLRLGRQALNWGSAQFFNPTDPFPQVLLAEPWRPRQGVNALRAHVPIADDWDSTLVVASNDTFTALRAALRLRFHWAETDIALLGAWRGDTEQPLVGLDLRGTLVLGWWVEAAYLGGDDPHEELAVGVDYSFAILERATIFAQYYRNGGEAGQAFALPGPVGCAIPGLPVSAPSTEDPFRSFTSGRDYLLIGGTLLVEPELSFSVAVLQNLGDGSGVAIPTVSYNILDWLDASFSAQAPYVVGGPSGEFKPDRASLRFSTGGARPITLDLSGLLADAVLTFWTRASF